MSISDREPLNLLSLGGFPGGTESFVAYNLQMGEVFAEYRSLSFLTVSCGGYRRERASKTFLSHATISIL